MFRQEDRSILQDGEAMLKKSNRRFDRFGAFFSRLGEANESERTRAALGSAQCVPAPGWLTSDDP